LDCLKTIIKEEGVIGVYKGFQSPLFGCAALNGALFWGYGLGKQFGSSLSIGERPQVYDSKGEQRMSLSQYIVAAGIGGSIVSWVEGPVDFVKCQLQMRHHEYRGFFDCLRKIVRERGITGLYQGQVATQIRNIPCNIFYFTIYEYIKTLTSLKLNIPVDKLPSYYVLLAGGMGGIGYWFLWYPFDVVKSSIQADAIQPAMRMYSGILDVARKLWRKEGIKAFYRGYVPCMLRAFPANAVCFFGYEYAMRLFNSRD